MVISHLSTRKFNTMIFLLITLLLIHARGELKVTEIHYHPIGQDSISDDEFEFIELKNVGTSPIDLTNTAFTDGISYSFPSGTVIESGKFLILASNSGEFQNRYGFEPSGIYTRSLNNGGEKITLTNIATSEPLISFSYNDKSPWPQAADGIGFSLVSKEANPRGDPNDPSYWRASFTIHGSPGADDTVNKILGVLINEALTHTDTPEVDAVELYNPHTQSIDISGWYLTDNKNKPRKFKIPAGTVMDAGSYKVYYENELGFSLNSHKDELYIFSANSADSLSGYCHGFSFGEIENWNSFGMHVTSEGKEHFVIQKEKTLGKENAGPRVGPLVFSEIMYNQQNNHEYIEITNISNKEIRLYDPKNPKNTWRVGGVAFEFPENIFVPIGGIILLVKNNISTDEFKKVYNVPDGIQIFSDTGSLSNGGETVTLYKPETPYFDTSDATIDTIVPYLIIDRVQYNDTSPWPTEPDGNGPALERKTLGSYGNDPANWRSKGGTPGIVPIKISFNTIKKHRPHFYVSTESLKSPFVSIHFDLKKSGAVSLDVFGSNGRFIKNVYGGDTMAGKYHLKLRKNIFPSGLFFLRLHTNDTFSYSRKFIVIK